MAELAGLSDWVLAVLPRLFLYPGGLWMLTALLLLSLASRNLAALKPRFLAWDFSRASLPAMACAWACLALSPLPGANPLPSPVDTLVLIGLALVSLALDSGDAPAYEIVTSAGIALAVLAPLAAGPGLLVAWQEWSISSLLSLAATWLGLLSLLPSTRCQLGGECRWLAWLALGSTPLLSLSSLPGVVWASLVAGLAILVLAGGFRLVGLRRSTQLAPLVWLLAAGALVAALLGA